LGFECGANPSITQLLAETNEGIWMNWVRQLSGAEPVTVNRQTVTFTTRYTPAMFANPAQPNALDYVHQTILNWYPASQVDVQPYSMKIWRGEEMVNGKNLILTLPGASQPQEVVILSAHLDSLNLSDPALPAPGAEDNASGSATLIEVARLFRDHRFARTIQIVWFTGEEQGLLGSRTFVSHIQDPTRILGVLNLDMFGYDSDGDRCFELHVGELPQSAQVADCFTEAIDANQLDLPRYDYLTTSATQHSDHGSFWEREIGAVEVLENLFDDQLQDGCPNVDSNPYYHTSEDTADRLNLASAMPIVKAALATIANMAGILE